MNPVEFYVITEAYGKNPRPTDQPPTLTTLANALYASMADEANLQGMGGSSCVYHHPSGRAVHYSSLKCYQQDQNVPLEQMVEEALEYLTRPN